MKQKNVIVVGKGPLCIKICSWFNKSEEYNLEMVVPVVPEPTHRMSTESLIDWCIENNIEFLPDGNYENIPGCKEEDWKYDLVFSVFYDKIIKKWFIDKCENILNLHNAPLPKYRGITPINWALKNKENYHGVTIHKITPGIDDGDIIAKLEYSIYPYTDEVIDVLDRAMKYGYMLFENTLPMIDKIMPIKQNHNESSYYTNNDKKLLGDRSNFTREESK